MASEYFSRCIFNYRDWPILSEYNNILYFSIDYFVDKNHSCYFDVRLIVNHIELITLTDNEKLRRVLNF